MNHFNENRTSPNDLVLSTLISSTQHNDFHKLFLHKKKGSQPKREIIKCMVEFSLVFIVNFRKIRSFN